MNGLLGSTGMVRRSPTESALTWKPPGSIVKTCHSDHDNDHCEYNDVVRSMNPPRGK